MERDRAFGATIAILLAIPAFLCTVVLEFFLAGRVLPDNVQWDPVTLWQHSLQGKMMVTLALGVPVLVPLLAFVLVFIYAYRRFSKLKSAPPLR